MTPLERASDQNSMRSLLQTFIPAESSKTEAVSALSARLSALLVRMKALTAQVSALRISERTEIACLDGRISEVDIQHAAEELSPYAIESQKVEDEFARVQAEIDAMRARIQAIGLGNNTCSVM